MSEAVSLVLAAATIRRSSWVVAIAHGLEFLIWRLFKRLLIRLDMIRIEHETHTR
jgi:hypothetical protein